ncbi:PKD domain-containing protein [Chryseobacterium scophthalmum]|uniref:PKD domain-containing protein n=1 Tax=Chryseobacterium scophthalmum TaxID=59733 RepID=UPI003D03F67E
MDNQLKNISTQYRKFTKGQYVKSPQFNEFLDFFEDQDRLSKVMLQGVGIVCGLKPQPIYLSGQLDKILLSQGVALTTDGDLLTLNKTNEVSKELYMSDLKTINLENKQYTHFKIYDNFKVRYPSFSIGATNQIELWELATTEEANSDFQTINNLSNLEDKYLLLYLESYEKEIKPCRGVDCDNHGIQQIRNLKVLVTTADGINYILERDQIQKHPLFIENILEEVKQERVIVERLILDRGIDAQFSSSEVKDLYRNVLVRNNYGKNIFEKINAISNLIGISAVDHQNFKNKLEECLDQKAGFQYAYDVVKDLSDTYSEIIKLLPKAFTKCLPDLVSFPKHIMLGKLTSNIQLDSTRHQFYNSPVLDDDKATKKVILLINRFKQQVQNFRYSDDFENEAQIKITPSQKLNSLSNKAIPFYYQITEEFLKAWNFDKTSNRSSGENLGYDAGLLSSEMHIQNPLDFNIDTNSFYNIEGHQGMDYYEAFEKIKQIRDKQQLGFDIMGLSFGELKGNKDMFKAYFNEYVDKNPGLEHHRGAGKGDTFVIVYEIIGRATRVIADFSLPYICCTPKIDVKLTLPDPVICSKAAPVPFTVFPMNGDVRAVIDGRLIEGIDIIDGKYFFNPTLVNSDFYNQDISFTVNGKMTDCTIRVILQSFMNVDIDSVTPTEDSTGTTVKFKISGLGFKDYTYTWDFWDNGNWVNLNPDSEGFVTYVFRDLNPDVIPTIKVDVSLNGCIQNIALDDWYKETPVQLRLSKDVICSTSPSIPFTVSPLDGVVKADVVGGGVEIKDGKYVFNPKLVNTSLHGQVINFTVNDKPTSCSIKVITQPEVSIHVLSADYPTGSSNQTVVKFEILGNPFKDYTYSWDFLGNNHWEIRNPDDKRNVIYTYYDLNRENVPIVKVKISNGDCVQDIFINNDWYNPPAPTVTIDGVEFSRDNCCERITPTVKADIKGPVEFPLSSKEDLILEGIGEGPSTLIYSWAKIKGPKVTLVGANQANLTIKNLVAENYAFQLTVLNLESGVFAKKEIGVRVYSDDR